MSQSDSFIDEVNDEVRRDRLFGVFKRYGWIAILLVLVIVGGTAWVEWQKARDRAVAERFGDAVTAALESDGADARVQALQAISPETDGQREVLDLMIAEAARAAAGSGEVPEAAVAALDAAAASAQPGVYRDIATFRAQALKAQAMSPEERIESWGQLAQPGSGLRLLAQEQVALARIDAGDTEAAIADLRAILGDAEVTQGLRQRANQLIVALGAEPDAAS